MTILEDVITSFVSLTVGALLGSEFTRFFYKPRVIVKYKDLDPLEDETGIFWSLQIENYGRTVATNCMATLTLYDVNVCDLVKEEAIDVNENLPLYRDETIDLEYPRKQIVNESHFRPIRRTSLCWAKLGNPDILDINPGISQSVDLCKFHRGSKGNYFIFPSEDGWRRLRVRLVAKSLSGHILICPSNEFPTRVNFKFLIDDTNVSLKIKKPSIFYRLFRNKLD